jgi:hypothetical protein
MSFKIFQFEPLNFQLQSMYPTLSIFAIKKPLKRQKYPSILFLLKNIENIGKKIEKMATRLPNHGSPCDFIFYNIYNF